MNIKAELSDLGGYLWLAFAAALVISTFFGTFYVVVKLFAWLVK